MEINLHQCQEGFEGFATSVFWGRKVAGEVLNVYEWQNHTVQGC